MSPYRHSAKEVCRHHWDWTVESWQFEEWVPASVTWSCSSCGQPCGRIRSLWMTLLLGRKHPEWWFGAR